MLREPVNRRPWRQGRLRTQRELDPRGTGATLAVEEGRNACAVFAAHGLEVPFAPSCLIDDAVRLTKGVRRQVSQEAFATLGGRGSGG